MASGRTTATLRHALIRPQHSSLHQQRLGYHWKTSIESYYKQSVEWLARYNARVAIINALYTMQPHYIRALSLLAAEAVTRRDPLAWCYTLPITAREERLAEEAEHSFNQLNNERGLWRSIMDAIAVTVRLLWLLMLFSPVAFGAAIHALPGGEKRFRRQWLRLLRRTLEIGGPAFIKWGQWAATRHDLFPKDFCSELEKLHSQAPAHSLKHTRVAVAEAFGFGIEDLFSMFEEAPVASGSIGQIHRAELSDTGARLTGLDEGTLVAVKVRHPGVSESIERDFGLMMVAARVADFVPTLSGLRLAESLEQFAAPLREQVDLAREAVHLHTFNFNFRKSKNVSFPVPLYPLVAPSVLVESFEKGEHISAYVAKGAGAPHNTRLAQLGARTMLHMMILDNLIHADLHPGNILVTVDIQGGRLVKSALGRVQSLLDSVGVPFQIPLDKLETPKIVLLDAGMATRLSPDDQINMVGLFEAFSRLDGQCLADWVLKFAGEEQSCPDPEGFRNAVEITFDTLRSANIFQPNDTSSGADALANVLETVREYKVSLPGHIASTVVTTLVLEGWSHALDPHHSTLMEIQRMVEAKKGGMVGWKAWLETCVDQETLEASPNFSTQPFVA